MLLSGKKTNINCCDCPKTANNSCDCCQCPTLGNRCHCCELELNANTPKRKCWHSKCSCILNTVTANTQGTSGKDTKCCACPSRKKSTEKCCTRLKYCVHGILTILMGIFFLIGDNLPDEVCLFDSMDYTLNVTTCVIKDTRKCNFSKCTRATPSSVYTCRTIQYNNTVKFEALLFKK